MTLKQRAEYEDLVRIHTCALSDLTLVLIHIVAAKKYDDATETLMVIKRKTDIVAGLVSQLLPCTPTTEQKLDERNHDRQT